MDPREVDRDLLQERIAEVTEEVAELNNELHSLTVTRDMLYCLDEALIQITEDDECYPGDLSHARGSAQ